MDKGRLGDSSGTEYLHSGLTRRIVGAAIDVHRALGPGLLEPVYRKCLSHRLSELEIAHRLEVALPIEFRGTMLDCGYRMDLVVEERVVVELKAVDRLAPVHDAQLLTYLKLSGLRVGLILNFNSPTLRQGIRRLIR